MSHAGICAGFYERTYSLGGVETVLAWDRHGHWTQDEECRDETGRCHRNACELASVDYGHCLGTAHNLLDRFDESLPPLLEYAEVIQPDAMGRFLVGLAYENPGTSTRGSRCLPTCACARSEP